MWVRGLWCGDISKPTSSIANLLITPTYISTSVGLGGRAVTNGAFSFLFIFFPLQPNTVDCFIPVRCCEVTNSITSRQV